MLLTRHLGTNFCEILIEIHKFSLKKVYLKMGALLSQSQCVNFMTHFINGSWAHNYNLVTIFFTVIMILKIQSDHSLHMSWQLSYCDMCKIGTDWSIFLHVTATWIFSIFQFWAHKSFVKWVHGLVLGTVWLSLIFWYPHFIPRSALSVSIVGLNYTCPTIIASTDYYQIISWNYYERSGLRF